MHRRQVLLRGGSLAMMAGVGTAHAENMPAHGVHVPAEDALHQRSFLQWPVNRRVYKDAWFLDHVQQTIADIANAIADFEPVTVLAAADHHASARRRLSASVSLWDIPTDDLWCRDAGPIFATDGQGGLAVVAIKFNGWGGRQAHRNDARIARRVADRLGLPVLETGLVGEGGGVDHDGHGLMIAHESSWVHPNRNPGLTRAQIEARLLAAYGARRMIWSPGLRDADITDYHIDSLARLTGPGRVLINLPDPPDPQDPFHRAAAATHAALTDAGLTVDTIPEPRRRRVKTPDFVASYANFYVCNGAVIAPQFGDPETDGLARDALSRHFPGRAVLALDVDALGELGGGIHCATQQMPAA